MIPLICGVAGNVWLRFLVDTSVFKDSWAADIILESESQFQANNKEPISRTKFFFFFFGIVLVLLKLMKL